MSEKITGRELFLVDQDNKRVQMKVVNELLENCSDEPAIQIAYQIAEAKKDKVSTGELEYRLQREIGLMNNATRIFVEKTKKHKYINQ